MLDVTYAPEVEIAKQLITQTVVTVAASGTTVLIAAPGTGKILGISFLRAIRTNGNTGATVALIKNGNANIDYGDFSSDIPGYVFWDASSLLQIRFLTPNTALTVNHDTANSITYTIGYLIQNT